MNSYRPSERGIVLLQKVILTTYLSVFIKRLTQQKIIYKNDKYM